MRKNISVVRSHSIATPSRYFGLPSHTLIVSRALLLFHSLSASFNPTLWDGALICIASLCWGNRCDKIATVSSSCQKKTNIGPQRLPIGPQSNFHSKLIDLLEYPIEGASVTQWTPTQRRNSSVVVPLTKAFSLVVWWASFLLIDWWNNKLARALRQTASNEWDD